MVLIGRLVTGCGGGEPTNPTRHDDITGADRHVDSIPWVRSRHPVRPVTGSPGATQTLQGTLQSGVESGCVSWWTTRAQVLANLVDFDIRGAQEGARWR